MSSGSATGRANGKVILLGEHAVVHGVPALVAGLSRGAVARATPAERDRIHFEGTPLDASHELHGALAAARAKLGTPPVLLELELEIPAGSGLGASAALGVASVRALGAGHGEPVSAARLAAAIDAWERVFHGNPSGIDAAAASQSDILYFVRGREPEPVFVRHPLHLVVAVAEAPASTKKMVEGVAKLKAARPEAFEKVLSGIGALVENAALCLRAGDDVGLGKLMDLNQMLLSSWLVSTDAIERACDTARKAGALGAKLTGSGGGGCIIALCAGDGAEVLAALRADGLPCFGCEVGRGTH